MDEETVNEQNIHEHYKKIEAENHHLKIQLSRKSKDIKRLKRIIKDYKEKLDKDNPKKQHYKNGRRGTKYNG